MARGEIYEHFVTVEEIAARPLPWKPNGTAPGPYRLGWRSICKCGFVSVIAGDRDVVIAAGKAHKDDRGVITAASEINPAGATVASGPRDPEPCAHVNCRTIRRMNPRFSGCILTAQEPQPCCGWRHVPGAECASAFDAA